MTQKRLGRGLGALLDFNDDENLIQKLPIEKISPSEEQPRKFFDDDSLKELAESIKRVGILNPIIVKSDNGNFKIISGERRFRAAQIAGLTEVPVIIKEEINERTSFEISLIENIHREDLNPIEEAESYRRLIDEFNYTHQQVAELIGKDRSYVTNILRLLKLSDFAKKAIIKGLLTTGHCKVLVNLSEEEQDKLCKIIIERNLSVRETENLVRKLKDTNNNKRENIAKVLFLDEFRDDFENITKKLNTKIDLEVGKREKGKLIIHFKNKEELKKILDELRR